MNGNVFFLLAVAICFPSVNHAQLKNKTLHILHLTAPYLNWDTEAIIEFVLSMVNDRQDMLPEFHLKLHTYNSKLVCFFIVLV